VAWDAANSLVTGEKEGVFRQIENGNYVDAVLGQVKTKTVGVVK